MSFLKWCVCRVKIEADDANIDSNELFPAPVVRALDGSMPDDVVVHGQGVVVSHSLTH